MVECAAFKYLNTLNFVASFLKKSPTYAQNLLVLKAELNAVYMLKIGMDLTTNTAEVYTYELNHFLKFKKPSLIEFLKKIDNTCFYKENTRISSRCLNKKKEP
jgi:hypothetical protein